MAYVFLTSLNEVSHGSNAPSKETLLKTVQELGAAEAAGKRCRHEFLGTVAIGAQNGYWDMKDAEMLWQQFAAGAASLRIETGEKSSDKQRVSELRQVIQASKIPAADFAQTIADFPDLYRKLKAEGATNVKLNDAFIVVARRQNKLDRDITEAEIRSALAPQAKETSEEKELGLRIKQLNDFVDKFGPSNELAAAINLLNRRLADLVAESAQAKRDAVYRKTGPVTSGGNEETDTSEDNDDDASDDAPAIDAPAADAPADDAPATEAPAPKAKRTRKAK